VGDRKYLQITAPVSHGSSGSPILNSYGQAVGFVSFNFTEGQSLNMGLALSEAITAGNNGFRTPGQFYADNGNADNVAVKAPDSPETPAAEVPSPVTPVAETDVSSLSAPRTLAEYKAQMASIPGGSFQMGSSDGDADEKPVHSVTMSPFKMGRTPVTVAMWKEYCAATGKVMPKKTSWGWIDDHPIVNVSWNDAKAYCDWAKLQLPTEAQWEYAAKGGKNTKYPWGDDFDESKVVWGKNSGHRTAPVYRRARVFVNAFGIVDMGGNVWQWCADWYAESYYETAPERDPQGPSRGVLRVLRTGSWGDDDPVLFRCSYRGLDFPTSRYFFLGFRCCAPPGLR
jgi:formylglycine-generating enzyme required for sulfatase activity